MMTMRAIAAPIFSALVALLATGCSGADTQDVLRSTSTTTGTPPGTPPGSPGSTPPGSSGSSPPPPGDCTPEEEPNDSKDQANELASERCGTLSGEDSRDFLTFRLKGGTKRLGLDFQGRVKLRVTVNGEVVDLEPDSNGSVPFRPNADYFIEVRPLTGSSSSIDWRVRITET